MENILYSTGNIGIGLLRAFTAVPGHAAWGGIMGCHLPKRILQERDQVFFHKTLFIPILLHGLYDCFLFTAVEISNSVPEGHEISDKDSGVILFCFLMFLFTLGLSLRMVYKYLREMRAKQDVKASDS